MLPESLRFESSKDLVCPVGVGYGCESRSCREDTGSELNYLGPYQQCGSLRLSRRLRICHGCLAIDSISAGARSVEIRNVMGLICEAHADPPFDGAIIASEGCSIDQKRRSSCRYP